MALGAFQDYSISCQLGVNKPRRREELIFEAVSALNNHFINSYELILVSEIMNIYLNIKLLVLFV